MQLKLKDLLGTSEAFILEHRILNAITIVGVFLTLFFSATNYFAGLPIVTVYGTLFSAFVCALIHIYSLITKNFKYHYILAFGFFVFVFLPLFWTINGGSQGGTAYYLMFIFAVLKITSRNRNHLFFSISTFVVLTLLIGIEYNFPSIIIGYNTREERFIDISLSLFIALIAFSVVLEIFSTSTVEPLTENYYKK
ncbi:MAG: hypothetical protein NZ551_06660 [Microscillaceae bacterium]|nr:hypothetical protein [Microscillaceae bacterium]MDW8460875.1 hypothetical protein [Cytophagales bacterium]